MLEVEPALPKASVSAPAACDPGWVVGEDELGLGLFWAKGFSTLLQLPRSGPCKQGAKLDRGPSGLEGAQESPARAEPRLNFRAARSPCSLHTMDS